jgi:tripartite-type tricarboxylate transporter receptor subunit TctC
MRAIERLDHVVTACLIAVIAGLLGGIGPTMAQVYPSRPITMIVPFPAGGPSDTVARIVADGMRASLKQPIVIENVVGASGSIAVGRAARAAADGYTLSYGGLGPHVLNGALFALHYDPVHDFEPVALLADMPMLIVAKNTMPAANLKELIAWLRANPDNATCGIPGAGTISEIAGIFFQNSTGTRFRFVPYRGVGFAMQDLMAGRIDMMIDFVANSLPQVRAHTIKAYAVLAKHRLSAAPDIPTADEEGVPGLYASSWQGLWVPKGTPKAAIDRLNGAAIDALADPAVRRRLAEIAQEIPAREQQTPDALGKLQKAEVEKWWPIIKTAGIVAE